MPYCPDYFNHYRRQSVLVRIGGLLMGGDEPIRVQSMTNTSTLDTDASVSQCLRIVQAGADLVRLTAQGEREAANLANIRAALNTCGCVVPLVADIHFNPKAADEAALHVEKVRINPGNYVDPVKTFRHYAYTDEEYAQELLKIRERFLPFLDRCRSCGTAIRIGVNHGSLSDRIMSRYGDTSAGMVESCLEFLRLCVETDFNNVVISIKASNTLVMVQTVRLLVTSMDKENMQFPLHLGVTEAGDGEDGRIKSAVGIGTLLLDGIGDTIRVSLSEDPEREIPVAKRLLEMVAQRQSAARIEASYFKPFNPFFYQRRNTRAVGNIGGSHVPVVMVSATGQNSLVGQQQVPDYYLSTSPHTGKQVICREPSCLDETATFPIISTAEFQATINTVKPSEPFVEQFAARVVQPLQGMIFLRICLAELNAALLDQLESMNQVVLLLQASSLWERRAFFHALQVAGCTLPVIVCLEGVETDLEALQLGLSLDLGPLLLDGYADGILVDTSNKELMDVSAVTQVLFGVLQATRLRITKTEYISCPGCGRTLFDLQQTIARIKSRTSHLTHLKIGIMGCIVNGPGEMADADYGYVGAGRGRISLYKGQTCIEKNISEDHAVEKLIDLIKSNGDWSEPPLG